MDAAEFDKFADDYLSAHAANIRISGEDPDYFARYKVQEVRRRWSASRSAEPAAILDFGTGIGSALPFLAQSFRTAQITGLDVSTRSLGVADRRFPGLATLTPYDGRNIPLQDRKFDLIFSACVFHHIEEQAQSALFGQLRDRLSADGMLVVFEHNPVNPVTRHIVATCPFDDNAVLIPSAKLKARQVAAGFRSVEVAYTGFFPGGLAALRPLERFMTAIPIGAQYYTLARI